MTTIGESAFLSLGAGEGRPGCMLVFEGATEDTGVDARKSRGDSYSTSPWGLLLEPGPPSARMALFVSSWTGWAGVLLFPLAGLSPREAGPILPVALSPPAAEFNPFIQLLFLWDVNICRVAFVSATC